MKPAILITGSSGHSGRAMAQLLQDQYAIRGIDLIAGEFTTHTGDLQDRAFLDRVMDGVTGVIHTASLHAPHVATFSQEQFIDTNIKATLYLLEAAVKFGVKTFLYTSTTSLYGESMDQADAAVWVTEELPTVPRDIYDITKIAAEGLCRDFFDRERLQTAVLRVSRFWDEPLPQKVFYRMYRGVDVRDVAEAHRLALETDWQTFEILNISAQSLFSRDDLTALKADAPALLEARIPELIRFFEERNFPLPDSIDRVYVIDKARELLDYTPRHNIREYLRELGASISPG